MNSLLIIKLLKKQLIKLTKILKRNINIFKHFIQS